MKGTIAAAALVAGVAASHNAHVGFHQRRGADYFASSAPEVCTTVYTTVYVYPSQLPTAVANTTVYVVPSPYPETTVELSSSSTEAPYSSAEESSTTPVYTPYPVASSSSSSKAAYSAPAYSAKPVSSKPAYSAPVYSAKPVSSKAATPKPSSVSYGHGTGSYASTGRIVTKGNKWSITFTPYDESGNCMTASAVQSAISHIAELGFTTIRVYSTDCGVFENVVPAATSAGLKIVYGIFLDAGGSAGKGPFSSYANEQLEAIKENAPHNSVAMLIVGNESIFNQYTTAAELASYLDYVRKTLVAAGFPSDIAITTTEPVDVWQEQGAALCDHIDVMTAQIHAFFTSTVSSSQAGSFVKSQLALASAVCPEAAKRGAYVSESGWPHAGDNNGEAHATPEDQKIAITSIMEELGDSTCLFSYQDDHWKEPGALDVEQYFGVADNL